MLVIRSPLLTFALFYFISSMALSILVFNIAYDDDKDLFQLLIISPPLNSIFVFLFSLIWIERRFRLSYIPLICLILLLSSSILLSLISFHYLNVSKLIYFSLVYHGFFSLAFCFTLILIFVCYSYGFLCVHRYRNMMTNEQQTNPVPKETSPLKIDQLVLQASENDELHVFMSILPGRRIRNDIRNIEEDLNQLQHIQTMITLNEPKELSFMNMTKRNIFNMDTYSMYVRRTNINHLFYSIRDHFIPRSLSDYLQFIFSVVVNAKNSNRNRILVHCLDGMGRAGMTVICLELAYEYLKNKDEKQTIVERICHYPLILSRFCRVCKAICNVRKARSGTIRNPIQILFIHEFYARLKSTSYMQQIETFLQHAELFLLNNRSSI